MDNFRSCAAGWAGRELPSDGGMAIRRRSSGWPLRSFQRKLDANHSNDGTTRELAAGVARAEGGAHQRPAPGACAKRQFSAADGCEDFEGRAGRDFYCWRFGSHSRKHSIDACTRPSGDCGGCGRFSAAIRAYAPWAVHTLELVSARLISPPRYSSEGQATMGIEQGLACQIDSENASVANADRGYRLRSLGSNAVISLTCSPRWSLTA